MNKIYDNGALLLGNVQDIIKLTEKQIKENIDMGYADYDDLLKDLKELRDIDYNMVVCINYDNGMGYTLDYWHSSDKVEEN